MKETMSRARFLAGATMAGLALPRQARAQRFAQRYEFACEQISGFSFLVDPPVNPLQPHPSIADRVRRGELRQRERVEFPYFGDIMRSVAYYEDPNKPLSAANSIPAGDPRVLIEIFTDVTGILVKKDPFLHFAVTGLVVSNPTSTFFGDLTWRLMTFSAALDPGPEGTYSLRLPVSSVASSHVLGARAGSGILKIKEGGLL